MCAATNNTAAWTSPNVGDDGAENVESCCSYCIVFIAVEIAVAVTIFFITTSRGQYKMLTDIHTDGRIGY